MPCRIQAKTLTSRPTSLQCLTGWKSLKNLLSNISVTQVILTRTQAENKLDSTLSVNRLDINTASAPTGFLLGLTRIALLLDLVAVLATYSDKSCGFLPWSHLAFSPSFHSPTGSFIKSFRNTSYNNKALFGKQIMTVRVHTTLYAPQPPHRHGICVGPSKFSIHPCHWVYITMRCLRCFTNLPHLFICNLND